MTDEWNLRYVSPEGVERRYHVSDIWGAAERFEKRFCAPMTREDEQRYRAALAIARSK